MEPDLNTPQVSMSFTIVSSFAELIASHLASSYDLFHHSEAIPAGSLDLQAISIRAVGRQ